MKLRHRSRDHLRIQMTARPGRDLIGGNSGRLDPVRIEGGVGVAFDHGHDYVTVSVRSDKAVAREDLERFLDDLPPGVLRVKGILRLTDSPQQRTIVHRVARRRSIGTEGDWPVGECARMGLIALAGTPVAELIHPLFA